MISEWKSKQKCIGLNFKNNWEGWVSFKQGSLHSSSWPPIHRILLPQTECKDYKCELNHHTQPPSNIWTQWSQISSIFYFHTKYDPLENCPRISILFVAPLLKASLSMSLLKYATKIVYNILIECVTFLFYAHFAICLLTQVIGGI